MLKLYNEDCLKILPSLEKVDAVVTDPPYGLNFDNLNWDKEIPGKIYWTNILNSIKPVGHLLAFGGTRTFHKLMVILETAGWELRDTICYVYGSGFNKGLNIQKSLAKAGMKGDWQGWNTTLKPAWEPIILARKPLEGNIIENITKFNTGGINADVCRVGDRYPSNFIIDGSEEVNNFFPYTKSGSLTAKQQENGGFKGTKNCYGKAKAGGSNEYPANEGSAARFFYSTRASQKDRGEGNNHPTCKNTKLMEYLCKLITPPNGIILDPFMGSGSTGVAALKLGFNFIGIEIHEEYFNIAQNRLQSIKTS